VRDEKKKEKTEIREGGSERDRGKRDKETTVDEERGMGRNKNVERE
jgi:hypothetical protein